MQADAHSTERTALGTGQTRPKVCWRILTLSTGAIAGLIAAGVVIWASARFGRGTTGSGLVASAAVAGVVMIVVLIGRATAPNQRLARQLVTAATALAGAALVVAASNGSVLTYKAQRAEPEWNVVADRVLADADPKSGATPCGPVTLEEANQFGLGPATQRCVTSVGRDRQVSWQEPTDDIGSVGLLYLPEATAQPPPEMCVAHLDGPWWQLAAATPSCPSGFTLQGI